MDSVQCPYVNAMYVSLPGELFSVTQVKLEMAFLVLLFGREPNPNRSPFCSHSICIQDIPGDNQLLSLHVHVCLWLLRVLSWSLIEDMYLWLIHELAYETKSRRLFTCNSREDKRTGWSCDPSCILVPPSRLSGVDRCTERKRMQMGVGSSWGQIHAAHSYVVWHMSLISWTPSKIKHSDGGGKGQHLRVQLKSRNTFGLWHYTVCLNRHRSLKSREGWPGRPACYHRLPKPVHFSSVRKKSSA